MTTQDPQFRIIELEAIIREWDQFAAHVEMEEARLDDLLAKVTAERDALKHDAERLREALERIRDDNLTWSGIEDVIDKALAAAQEEK